jgi:hypothetical protein
MAYVYKHIRKDTNEVFYVGIGTDNKGKYSRAHSLRRNGFWHVIRNKTDYSVEILFDNLTWEEACVKEKELIKEHGRKDLGLGTLCNLTDGGEGAVGVIVSDETKKKMSVIQSRPYNEKYPNSNEVIEIRRQKMVEFNKTYLPSKETNKKISKTLKGRPLSDEHILKIKQRALKRWGNDEIKKNVELYIINNPKVTEKQVIEKFSISRSMFWRIKQTINE